MGLFLLYHHPTSPRFRRLTTMADSLYHQPSLEEANVLRDLSTKLRIHSIKMTAASKSGHPTSCSSMAEVMSVLFFKVMKYKDPRVHKEQRDPASDRFILSKGHAAPILYAAWAEAGLFPTSELLKLRKIDSDLEGHPTPRLPFIDVATGSLGQGLSVAAGMAYCAKHFDKASYRTYCLIGDGESMEGNIWEALNFAGFYKLDNLSARTRPAVPNASNSCGLTSRKTTSKIPKTSSTSPPTRRWLRFSVLTAFALSEWPNSSLLISHKWVSKKIIFISTNWATYDGKHRTEKFQSQSYISRNSISSILKNISI